MNCDRRNQVIFSTNELFLKVGWFIWVILKLDDEVKGMKVGSPLYNPSFFLLFRVRSRPARDHKCSPRNGSEPYVYWISVTKFFSAQTKYFYEDRQSTLDDTRDGIDLLHYFKTEAIKVQRVVLS